MSAHLSTQMIDEGLSLDEFCAAAKSFIDKCSKIELDLPKWKWVSCQSINPAPASSNLCRREEEGYLSLENVYHFSEDSNSQPSSSEHKGTFDSATLVSNIEDEAHIYEFHIVYSFSYKVPVLYFRGYQSDGQPLGLDVESKWTYMTHEDHPYLRRPWFTLHPCGTSNWMRLLLNDTLQEQSRKIELYLPSWLSVVGQAVGLKLPLELQIKSYNSCPNRGESVHK